MKLASLGSAVMDSLSLNRNGATSLRSRASVVGSLQVSPPLVDSLTRTAVAGSLTKFTPGGPEKSRPGKGLETDTTVSGLRVNGPALLGAPVASVNAPARAS